MSRSVLVGLLLLGLPGSSSSPELRPHIGGVYSVTIKTSQLDKAKHFYEEDLRLPRARECLTEKAECFMVGPFQRIEISENSATSGASMIEAVAFSTNNARALRNYLMSQGLTPGKLISDPCGVQESFEIVDPDQHRLIFVTNNWGVAGSVVGAQISGRMIHSGFVVRDRAAEDKFYKDILGFHVYWHGGMRDGEDNWVDMQVPDGTDWIEYMLRVSPDASHKTLGVMNHIALGVPDIHAAQQQLIKNGWKGAEEPKIGRDGKWQLNLYDPDETRVELMEFKPTKEPCCSPYTGPHPGPSQ
jgi:catechol 2,3-dioxygenase-like lactoylglutathione lyase family enzyme